MTAKRRQVEKLQVRCIKRGIKRPGIIGHIRAELDRLARGVQKDQRNLKENAAAFKKSKHPQDYILYERCLASIATLQDVLDAIDEAKR